MVTAVTVIVGVLGARSVQHTSALTKELYDKPLMAADFAREALTNAVRLERAFAASLVAPADAAVLKALKQLEEAILDNLAIVDERATDADSRKLTDEIRAAVVAWTEARSIAPVNGTGAAGGDRAGDEAKKLQMLSDIEAQLDVLVEIAKGRGFDFREQATRMGDESFLLVVAASIATGFSAYS